MKQSILTLFFILLGALPGVAQTMIDPPLQVVTVRPTTTTATITLGDAFAVIAGFPSTTIFPIMPQGPLTFRRGTHLQIVMPVDGMTNPVVTFYKDDQPLPSTGATLDITSVTAADTGRYHATATDGATAVTKSSDTARVVVTETGAALLNYSTRAEISSSQSSVLSGFVVQPGPASSLVLIRAVGPALAAFGVAHPLAAPRLRIVDSNGHEVFPWENGTIVIVTPSGTAIPGPGSQVGAFPLPAGGKDVEHIYSLAPGAYTAEVSSADGGNGTVLLEMYQMPI